MALSDACSHFDAALVAELLNRTADHDTWQDRAGGHGELRSGVRLLHDDDYEVWLLCWSPGSRVTPHDHGGSSGAFSLVSGTLTEVRWENGVAHEHDLVAGEVVDVARGVVHDVVASGEPAFSVHAYAPPLTTMSFYDEEGRRVIRTEVVPDAPADLLRGSGMRDHPSGRGVTGAGRP
jgi:quercetin dioxygenase-like cupin family protein